MKKYLETAKLTKTQGLKGELRAQTYCDYPEFLEEFDTLYMGTDKKPVSIEYIRPQKTFTVVKLEGVNSIEEATALIGKSLYIDRADAKLPEDVWFIEDIIGLPVFGADDGKRYGVVSDILQNAPKDVYVIKTDEGKELLFPAIPEVLLSVDVEGGKIVIRPLDGLFDED